jgi:hypothetical protein
MKKDVMTIVKQKEKRATLNLMMTFDNFAYLMKRPDDNSKMTRGGELMSCAIVEERKFVQNVPNLSS